MDEKQCEIYRENMQKQYNVHEIRINNHSERLDKLEQFKSGTDVKIQNLIEKINSLVTTMRWFMGLIIGSFVGFFFYAVQHGVLK